MKTMTSTKIASLPQVDLIKTLCVERDWRSVCTESQEAQLTKIVDNTYETLTVLGLRSATASLIIKFLLNTPKVADTIEAPADVVTTTQPSTFNLLRSIPAAHYAVPHPTDPFVYTFVEIIERKSKKNPGKTYKIVNQLIGAPGSWHRNELFGDTRRKLIEVIAGNPLEYAQIYGDVFTACARCDSPLSDPKSIALRMGPKCYKKYFALFSA